MLLVLVAQPRSSQSEVHHRSWMQRNATVASRSQSAFSYSVSVSEISTDTPDSEERGKQTRAVRNLSSPSGQSHSQRAASSIFDTSDENTRFSDRT